MLRDYGLDGLVTPDTFTFVQIHFGDGFPTSWGNARASFYGVGGTPTSWFDGVLSQVGGYTDYNAQYNYYRNRYLQRRANATDVTIKLTGQPISGQTYTMEATVCVEPCGTGKTMRIYMAQVLDYWPMSNEGGNSYSRNGFKQAASTMDLSLWPGECGIVTRNFTFDATSWSRKDDLKVIVWAQRPDYSGPAEVYQALSSPWPFTPSCSDGLLNQDEVMIDCGGSSCRGCECQGAGECDDFQFCTGDETCDAFGTCQSSCDAVCTDPDFPYCNEAGQSCDECLTGGHCNDSDVCTTDACTDGACSNTVNTAPCDDGNVCTDGDTCSQGTCAAGDPVDCSDGTFCNGEETCDPELACQDGPDPCAITELCDEENDVCVAISTRAFLLPAGMDPGGRARGTPYRVTALGGEEVTFDVWVENTDPAAIQFLQVQMPCLAEGGDAGYIEFTSRALDEDRTDYIFYGLTTMGLGGNDGNCPGGGVPPDLPLFESPMTGTGVLSGTNPVVTDPKYIGAWSFTVSTDAQGVFAVEPMCHYGDPNPDCTANLTYVADSSVQPLPIILDPLEIEVAFGQCCYYDGGRALQCVDTTGYDCSNTYGGHLDGAWTCEDDCSFCVTVEECDDGDTCTTEVCDPGDETADVFGCVYTYHTRPYGDVSPFGSIVPPCPADTQGELGDGFANMLDVFCAFNAFNEGSPYTQCPCADVAPCGGDAFVNMLDVFGLFNAFNDDPACSAPCP